MKFKRTFALCLSAALLAGCGTSGSSSSSSSASGEVKKVGVVQLVDHTSLNTIYSAWEAQMKELGYTDDTMELTFKNGQGDTNTLASIADTFAGMDLDAVVAIATPAAQSVAKLADDTPVIFAAVSDPVGAELTSSLDAPDKNITGTCDEVQVDQILETALEVCPDTKTVGLLYNKGETNSVTNIKNAISYLEEKGIDYVETTITATNEVQSAVDTLTAKCDIIFSPNDNTVASAMSAAGQRATKAGVPFFTGADSMVQDGGFMTVGIDYEELGKETANMTDEVLKGTSVSDLPVKVFKDDLNIYVNKDVLSQLGLTLPDDIKNNEKLIEM